DSEVGVDRFADLEDFSVRQVLNATAVVDAQLVGDVDGGLAADAVNVGERDDHALVGRDVDTRNTCHGNLFSCSTGRLAPPYLKASGPKLPGSGAMTMLLPQDAKKTASASALPLTSV